MSRLISGRKVALVAAVSASMLLTAGVATSSHAATKSVAVSLITKDSTNPFFVAMQGGAKAAAAKLGVKITIASGKAEGDDAGQIAAIEAAIAGKQQGILITPMSTGVNDAIKKARAAGLFVIAQIQPTTVIFSIPQDVIPLFNKFLNESPNSPGIQGEKNGTN